MGDDSRNTPTRIMLVATEAVVRPKPQVGELFGVKFPRLIDMPTLLAVVAGAFLGLFTGTIIIKTLFGVLATTGIGAYTGWALTNYEPAPGINLMHYLRLRRSLRKRQTLAVDAGHKAAYIGVAQIHEGPAMSVKLCPGSIPIHPASYDRQRGVLR